MIIRSCLVLSVLFSLVLTALSAKDRPEPTISECAAKGGECDETKGRPVCGTDDQTYPSRCHLIRVQCSGHQVSLKYRGPCKACIEAREYALKHKAIGKSPPKFIPRCKSDGTYAPVQCLGDSGCWCSDITGKPIENTSVRTGKPRCREFNKANIRRSPARPLNSSNRSAARRVCTQSDRGAFNGNLVKIYQNEYLRSGVHKDMTTVPTDKTILDWKFTTLDSNANHMLDKNEFRELKKTVKRAVKPRRCSRAFGKFCDMDDDDRLSRVEWTNCLTKDPNHLRPRIQDAEPALRDSEGESDCLSDRSVALDEQKFGGTALYVPECTADGRYQRVQCYRSTGYCWCVHEDTGKNIPGTSVKDKRPQCDSLYPISRPMKGCPEQKKIEFLKDLKEFLKKQIASNTNTGLNTTKWNSEEERIGTLSFVFLDKNKNKAWERKEWKTFRELVTANKTLRKCGKKMPRYCDVNSDKKITLSEWLNCLQAQRLEDDVQRTTEKAETVTNRPSKLNGPNPLESYLKE